MAIVVGLGRIAGCATPAANQTEALRRGWRSTAATFYFSDGSRGGPLAGCWIAFSASRSVTWVRE